jgi:TatD DNase family protein
MPYAYLDAHCHVQFDAYDSDRDELIARMRERGVAGVVVGVDFASSKQAVELAETYEHLHASVGLNPNRAGEMFDADAYRALAAHPKVVAIGECGLDYYRPVEVNGDVKAKQRELLAQHIDLAADLGKPLIIHSRPSRKTQDAYRDLIGTLREAKGRHPHLSGDIHFFVGGEGEMRALVALGFTVSFTAVVTFAREYDSVIRAVPSDAILAETDAPYVPPTTRERGSRNDPLAVEDVVAKLAEIRGEDPEALRTVILENSRRLFAGT